MHYEIKPIHLFKYAICGPTNCEVKGINAKKTAKKVQKFLEASYVHAFNKANEKHIGETINPHTCDTATLPITVKSNKAPGWGWDRPYILGTINLDILFPSCTSNELKPFHSSLIDAFIAGATDGYELKKKEVTKTAFQSMYGLLPELRAKFGETLTISENAKENTISLHFPFRDQMEELTGSALTCTGGLTFTAKEVQNDKFRAHIRLPVLTNSPDWLTKQNSLMAVRLRHAGHNEDALLLVAIASYAKKQGISALSNESVLYKLAQVEPEETTQALIEHKEVLSNYFGKSKFEDLMTQITQVSKSNKNINSTSVHNEIDIF